MGMEREGATPVSVHAPRFERGGRRCCFGEWRTAEGRGVREKEGGRRREEGGERDVRGEREKERAE